MSGVVFREQSGTQGFEILDCFPSLVPRVFREKHETTRLVPERSASMKCESIPHYPEAIGERSYLRFNHSDSFFLVWKSFTPNSEPIQCVVCVFYQAVEESIQNKHQSWAHVPNFPFLGLFWGHQGLAHTFRLGNRCKPSTDS
jgi:hypothetical protein